MADKKKRIPWNKGKHIPSKTIGYHHYNNGTINIVAKECPEGFVPGWMKQDYSDAVKKRRQTCLERHGSATYNNPEKNKQTCFEKYGASTWIHSVEGTEQLKNACLVKHGCSHFCNREKGLQTIEKKYGLTGITNISQVPEIKRKAQQTNLKKYGSKSYLGTEQCKEKTKQYNLQKYGVEYYAQTPECHSKMRKHISVDKETFDSSWEVDVYNYCIRNNISIERNIPLNYEFAGKKHTTIIDFKIDNYLIEVKGTHLLEGTFSDILPISEKLKVYKKNHVIVVTQTSKPDEIFGKPNSLQSNGLKYLNKCPEPLIGIDINLFRNPEFPYRDDRPKCFYEVRVDNDRSAIEAFKDEAFRWEMIKNRIEYSGGYIDAKQVLQAMNVTRKCKQPSWFSKNFAKNIITKYATSDVIVDPFAGWGARSDASIELHKEYIGCDLNKELVEWHQSKNRNIILEDATNFKYKGQCTLFICPPYQDVETYFEGQDSQTTQCQWLLKTMINVPNANEYILVCKVVDQGFEKYIKEEKINKSHFGKNIEYVLVVSNKEAKQLLKTNCMGV